LEKLVSDGEWGEEGLIESTVTSSGSANMAEAAFSVSAAHRRIIETKPSIH